ncbi:toll-like receptor 4 [Mytilus trossulus]|uniref:toll-like receptor 4 n=1 Tax=Mytilus trossulus TaxID=6551 RepID=UPI0030066559
MIAAESGFRGFILLIVGISHASTKYSPKTSSISNTIYVDYSKRNLTEIPRNIPRNSTMLDFHRNIITDIPSNIFRNMSDVTWMDLSQNWLNQIRNESFAGLNNLTTLNVSHNHLHISDLEHNAFVPIQQLRTLRIDHLKFPPRSKFPEQLVNIKQLEILELAAFIGMTFDERFKSWTCLHTFISKSSYGLHLQNYTFAGLANSPLRTLSIKIKQADDDALEHLPNLQILNLYFGIATLQNTIENSFKMVSNFTILTRILMQRVNARAYIFIVTGKYLHYFENICLKELVFRHMYLADIDGTSFKEFAINSVCLESLEVSGNIGSPWITLLVLFKNLKHLKLSSIENNAFLKQVRMLPAMYLSLPKTLETIDLQDINLKMPLPNITFINGDNVWFLTCRAFTLIECNGSLRGLKNLRYLDVSENRCGNMINEYIFQNFSKLEYLIATHSDLGTAFRNNKRLDILLKPLKNLKHLDISYNNFRIADIANLDLQNQYNVLHSFNGSNNGFNQVPSVFRHFRNLSFIDISYNNLSTFNRGERDIIDSLIGKAKVVLVGNPFKCSCSNLDFLKWAKQTKASYFGHLYCQLESGENTTFSDLFVYLDRFENRCHDKIWLIFSLSFTTLVVILVVFVVIYLRYRSAFQYFYLRIKLRLKRYEELDGDSYLYDVFICYNHNDVPWVVNFNRRLTAENFKTCLDAKDFIAGEAIAENILRAIDSSRKIIFIITEHFLQSTWGNYEMELTRMHAFQEGRENMVIVIMKDDLSIHQMPKVLKRFWYKVTCIKWYDQGIQPFQTEEIFYENVFSSLSIA